jgi:hypothetical protein
MLHHLLEDLKDKPFISSRMAMWIMLRAHQSKPAPHPQAMGQEMMSFSAMASMAGSLPPNARYVTHRNECYDWGTLGWLLTTKQVP